MANKTLTAKVRFETKSAEASLDRLAKKINNVQNAINKTSKNNTKLTAQINKAATATNRLNTATNKVATTTNKIVGANNKAVNSAKKLSGAYNAANRSASNLSTTVKRLAATYLGVMGTKAMVTTSDSITSTQNKLNALNGGDKNLTQEQMDKMYTSSSKVRMNYTDMLANASKSMTLAGGAFQNNMDNAIRFQEIMAETYALGGASAPEMSNSMYQLIQALGSGTLQGDELRAVREGAPLAYQAIEKFAQGVYNSNESLKDMASQGKITSDMVVAAIMNAGTEMDAKFEETAWTFEAVWNRIKSAAVKAFEPVSNMLSEMLNRVAESGLFEKMEQGFLNISKVIQITFVLIENSIEWLCNNWNWLRYVAIFALTAITAYLLYMGAQSVATALQSAAAWMIANWQLLLIIAVIAAVVVALVWLSDSFADACGIIVGSIVAAVAFVWNLLVGVINAIIQLVWSALAEPFLGIIEWILNACMGGFDSFGDAVANLIGQVISWFLSLGQVVTTIIDAIFGTNWTGGLESLKSNIIKWGKNENAITVTREAPKLKRWAYGDAYNTGYDWGSNAVSGLGGSFNLDSIGEKLGLDFADSLLKTDPSNLGVGDAYKIPDTLGDIADDTSDINKSMELSKEDLDYLRKLAEMEWKKEFTTASIKIDMSNYNNINGETDLDGIVTKLADKLYEEMNIVANGVYA